MWFGGGEAKSKRYPKGIGVFREGNEEIKVEGKACGSLPQLDGGIWQLQNGISLHENRTPSQTMGAA